MIPIDCKIKIFFLYLYNKVPCSSSDLKYTDTAIKQLINAYNDSIFPASIPFMEQVTQRCYKIWEHWHFYEHVNHIHV